MALDFSVEKSGTYDPYLTLATGLKQTSIQVDCSIAGAGIYNYIKPLALGDTTNYEFQVTFGFPTTRIIPAGTIIWQGAAGSTTPLTANLIYITYLRTL